MYELKFLFKIVGGSAESDVGSGDASEDARDVGDRSAPAVCDVGGEKGTAAGFAPIAATLPLPLPLLLGFVPSST